MTKRMALLRTFFGLAQMTGAATAGLLLITSGVTRVSIAVTVATCCLTGMSLLLFRNR
jgi:hypothetical protein